MDCSPLGSSVCGISQGKRLHWFAISLSGGFSQPRDQTHVSCIGRQIFLPLNHQRSPQILISYLFKHNINSVYMSIPTSQFIPPSALVQNSLYYSFLRKDKAGQGKQFRTGNLNNPQRRQGTGTVPSYLASGPGLIWGWGNTGLVSEVYTRRWFRVCALDHREYINNFGHWFGPVTNGCQILKYRI